MSRNSTYYVDENHTYMIKSNILWLKVFYHNTTNGDYFTTLEETLDSHTKQKFSILGSIGSDFHVKGKYEFLLEAPGKRGYNRWRQSVHPKDTTTSSNEATNGYEPIKLSWKTYFYGGLSTSSSYQAFFDCSAGAADLWWFPIGAKWSYMIKNTIPIYQYYEGTEIALWIRMPTLSVDGFRLCSCACARNNIILQYSYLAFLIFNS